MTALHDAARLGPAPTGTRPAPGDVLDGMARRATAMAGRHLQKVGTEVHALRVGILTCSADLAGPEPRIVWSMNGTALDRDTARNLVATEGL